MAQGRAARGDRIDLSGVSTARSHRSLDERILVRFPALAHRVASLWSRLPPGSRLRRRLLVHIGVMVASAANRRDFDVMLLFLDPAIEYRPVSAGPGREVIPDLVGTHHGHDGYLHVWRALLDSFPDLALEPRELLDRGDRFMSVTELSARGSVSGAPFDVVLYQVFILRRGRAVKQEDHFERQSALEALVQMTS